jgi:hypothetical protein
MMAWSVIEAPTERSLASLGITQNELQPYQIDQELAPEIKHPAPGIFYVACGRLFENAFMNVVRDLIAQIVLHFRLNLFLVERVDCRRIHTVSPEKIAMALIKLPE